MCLTPVYIKNVGYVPCRKCIECRIQYSEEWAKRCILEAQKHSKNCFITLTYNEANLPVGKTLRKRDFQLFMKRLRKRLSADAIKIRYFACGEYGSKFDRPHYHAIIFGWFPSDAYFFKFDNKHNMLYRSKLLESCWTLGFSSVGVLTEESAKYCAKYMQGDLPKCDNREKPFTLSSRRPGIALDVIPATVYRTGDLYLNGKRFNAPRSFMKKVKEEFPEYYELIKYKKLNLSERLASDYDLHNSGYAEVDESIRQLWLELCHNDVENNNLKVEVRKKKYLNIFGNSLDKRYRPAVSLKCRKDNKHK